MKKSTVVITGLSLMAMIMSGCGGSGSSGGSGGSDGSNNTPVYDPITDKDKITIIRNVTEDTCYQLAETFEMGDPDLIVRIEDASIGCNTYGREDWSEATNYDRHNKEYHCSTTNSHGGDIGCVIGWNPQEPVSSNDSMESITIDIEELSEGL